MYLFIICGHSGGLKGLADKTREAIQVGLQISFLSKIRSYIKNGYACGFA
jgi:hypothetical protein